MTEKVYRVHPVGEHNDAYLLETVDREEALRFAKEQEANGQRMEVYRRPEGDDMRPGIWTNEYTSPPV